MTLSELWVSPKTGTWSVVSRWPRKGRTRISECAAVVASGAHYMPISSSPSKIPSCLPREADETLRGVGLGAKGELIELHIGPSRWTVSLTAPIPPMCSRPMAQGAVYTMHDVEVSY